MSWQATKMESIHVIGKNFKSVCFLFLKMLDRLLCGLELYMKIKLALFVKIIFSAFILISFSGCSSKELYESIQPKYDESECIKLPPHKYEECIQLESKSYKEYQKEREEVINQG